MTGRIYFASLLLIGLLTAVGCDEVKFESVDETECASGEKWASGNTGSDLMHPGRNCISCHRQDGGPSYDAAGTVMWRYDEPDDCRGVEGVQVTLIGADGSEVTRTTNSAGNFYWKNLDIPLPYTARVVAADGSVREMTTPQMDGQCANCHSQTGAAGAPGRIIDPALAAMEQ